jgi:predicted ATPase
LAGLAQDFPSFFEALAEDARELIPGLKDLDFAQVGGPDAAVVLEIEERNLRGRTRLRELSYGSVRILALLALLHDPEPPALTCVEEFDHGLHPYAFDLLIDRLRQASEKSQYLIATHSPTVVNRLRANEPDRLRARPGYGSIFDSRTSRRRAG